MVIGTAAEEHHAVVVAVSFLEAHEFGPEPDRALNISDLVNKMAKLVDLDRRSAGVAFRVELFTFRSLIAPGLGISGGNIIHG